jgi:hypothetical protein
MKVDKEKRRDKRWQHMAFISFAYFNRESEFYARTLNYGAGGMCIKSHFCIKPGTIVLIRLKKSNSNGFCAGVSKGLCSVLLVEVKWCGEIRDNAVPAYGIGVRYFPPVY